MQKTCIVIPCYNEEARLDVKVFCEFLEKSSDIHLLFSNDGSTDATQQLLEGIKGRFPGKVNLHVLEKNSGKAEAVRQGVLKAYALGAYTTVGFWDADLATPLTDIEFFKAAMLNGNKKIAIGSRMKRLGATVERKRSRHLLGRVFSTFSSIILKLPVYDTQCGAKLFDKDQAYLFEQTFSTKWLFDIELLARFRNKHGVKGALDYIIEVPVNAWIEKGGSKLRLKHMLNVPFELLRINSIYNK